MRSSELLRWLYVALGMVSLALGVIGIFLPLLPTTPFVLLAAFFFSKSSETLHQWLLRQRHFGPLIENWTKHGVISRKAKALATFTIILSFGSTVALVRAPVYAKVALVCMAFAVLGFILSRPSEVKDNSRT